MNPGDRNVTKKDLITAILVTGYMSVLAIVSLSYSKIIGILLSIPAIFLVLREFRRLPQESKQKITEKIKEQQNSPFQKAISIIGYLLIAYIVYALVVSSIK